MVIREGDRAHRSGNAISNLLNNDSTYLTDNESTTATAIDKRQYKREEGALRKTRPGSRQLRRIPADKRAVQEKTAWEYPQPWRKNRGFVDFL